MQMIFWQTSLLLRTLKNWWVIREGFRNYIYKDNRARLSDLEVFPFCWTSCQIWSWGSRQFKKSFRHRENFFCCDFHHQLKHMLFLISQMFLSILHAWVFKTYGVAAISGLYLASFTLYYYFLLSFDTVFLLPLLLSFQFFCFYSFLVFPFILFILFYYFFVFRLCLFVFRFSLFNIDQQRTRSE